MKKQKIPKDLQHLVDKKYVDIAATALGTRYYMTNNSSDVSNYKLCSLAAPTESEAYYEKLGLTNNSYIMGWISAEGERRAKLIKGVYNWHITTKKQANKLMGCE